MSLVALMVASSLAASVQQQDARVCVHNISDREVQVSVFSGQTDRYQILGVLFIRREQRACLEWNSLQPNERRIVQAVPAEGTSPISTKMRAGGAFCNGDSLQSEFVVSHDGTRFICAIVN